MRLLVGLGNPGSKYERTRHNVGFRIAQLAAEKLGVAIDQTRWNAELGTGRSRGERIAVLLPQTYMNVSGESAGHAVRFWKVDPAQVVAAHDELDLEFGRIQVKVGGGDGGHNGLKSLRQHLGPDFVRVRFGIGRPPQGWDPADFVLAKFSAEEEKAVEELLPTAADAAVAAMLDGAAAAMNRFNRRPKEAAGEKGGEVEAERRSRLGRRRAEGEGPEHTVTLAGSAASGKPKR